MQSIVLTHGFWPAWATGRFDVKAVWADKGNEKGCEKGDQRKGITTTNQQGCEKGNKTGYNKGDQTGHKHNVLM